MRECEGRVRRGPRPLRGEQCLVGKRKQKLPTWADTLVWAGVGVAIGSVLLLAFW